MLYNLDRERVSFFKPEDLQHVQLINLRVAFKFHFVCVHSHIPVRFQHSQLIKQFWNKVMAKKAPDFKQSSYISSV